MTGLIVSSAVTLLLQGQDLAKSRKRVSWGYLAAKTTLKAYFPSLPHHKMFPYVRGSSSRFYRVLQKAQAHLAVPLSGGRGLLQGVDLNPSPWPTATASTASAASYGLRP